MKSRYYLTVVCGVIMGIFVFLTGWDPQIAIGIFVFGIILLIPFLVFIVAWNLVAAFRLWQSQRLWSFLPLGLLLLSFCLFPPIARLGLHLRVQRFIGQQAEYEKLAAVALRNDQAEMDRLGFKVFTNCGPNYISIDLPEDLSKLAWGIRVRKDPGDEVGTVIFVYAGGFGHHYADYVYRPDGNISNALRKFNLHLQAPINTNWCAAGG